MFFSFKNGFNTIISKLQTAWKNIAATGASFFFRPAKQLFYVVLWKKNPPEIK